MLVFGCVCVCVTFKCQKSRHLQNPHHSAGVFVVSLILPETNSQSTWKMAGPKKEKIVFQPPFFSGFCSLRILKMSAGVSSCHLFGGPFQRGPVTIGGVWGFHRFGGDGVLGLKVSWSAVNYRECIESTSHNLKKNRSHCCGVVIADKTCQFFCVTQVHLRVTPPRKLTAGSPVKSPQMKGKII